MVLDDAYSFLRSRNLNGKHLTIPYPDTVTSGAKSMSKPAEQCKKPGALSIEDNVAKAVFPRLLIWSAADEQGLKRISALYQDYFERSPGVDNSTDFQNLVYTLVAKRTSLTWRSFAVASDLAGLHNLDSKISRAVRSSDKRSMIFAFTGQGAQYAQMGQELLTYPVFRESLRDSQTILDTIGCSWSLIGSQRSTCLKSIC